jgi:acyl-CoA synthetase (AMP-forming)/AMP-acid ligase II
MEAIAAPCTLPSLLAHVVAARAGHPALLTPQDNWSYAELERRTATMARALLASGAGKGTRIALLAPDGALWLTAFLASLRIGALVSVLSTLCTPPELAHLLRASDAQILIGARRFLRHDYARKLSAALPGLENARAGRLHLRGAPYLRAIWLDDAQGLPWARSVDALLASADAPDAPDAALLAAVEKEVAPGDDAVIVYTSGSTALPKAVVHTQSNVTRHPREVARYFLLKDSDRMMPLLPAFWLGGMVMALEVLSVGATLVYAGSPEHADVLAAIRRFKVNRVNGWGDMLVKLRQAAVAQGIDVDSIVGLGPFRDREGEIIPLHLQANLLGMSETFAVHSAEPLDARLPYEKAGSSGRTVNGYERRIVHPETGAVLPPGEIGELQLRGGALMSGFYKVERHKVFTPDGFYPTGDLVRVDTDGHLYFIARRGDMIKTRAANVSRLEVEAALRGLAGVAQAVVAGVPDAELGQMVVAAVVPAPGAALSEESLKAALQDVLSSYKVPRRIVFVSDADVPRTATGKIKLADVARTLAERVARTSTPLAGAAPRSVAR